MKNKPQYAVTSVDHALRLALMLQQEGPMRSAELADRLGVARSTAHRLLAMLVYRGFAEQGSDRRYEAGPVLRDMSLPSSQVANLRATSLPYLQALRNETGETANLQVLVSDQARFVTTAESAHLLKVGDREGRLLPAWQVSGGRVLLAELSDDEIASVLAGQEFSDAELEEILRGLQLVRRRGFAINDQTTEPGVTALAQPIRSEDGTALAAVSVAMPSSRFSRSRLPQLNAALARTVSRIGEAIAQESSGR